MKNAVLNQSMKSNSSNVYSYLRWKGKNQKGELGKLVEKAKADDYVLTRIATGSAHIVGGFL
jgi:hypothetical protein